jgi:molybdopterin converting factor small subunit
MSVTLLIPTALRMFTDRQKEVPVAGDTVLAALQSLVEKYPDLRQHLFVVNGDPRSLVNFFLGDQNVKDLGGFDTPIADGATVMLVPAIAVGHS